MPTSIPLPRISFGKRKERSQACELFTEDGRIIDKENDALHGCVQDPLHPTQDGYILSVENQFYDEGDGLWKQQLNEVSGEPICMISEIQDVESLKTQIFKDASRAAKLQRMKEAGQSVIFQKLTLIISIVCATLLVIFAMQHWG